MTDSTDTNESIWKSDRMISDWVSSTQERERRRTDQRELMAELLPFAPVDEFTFVDLGAGTGAAARAVLDHYPAARAILADYSPQMMAAGSRELAAYDGRYVYVEFDLAAGTWPAEIPDRVAAMVSSLSVHHLENHRKQALFREILQRLAPGGWYLNYDPVSAGDDVVEAAWQRAGDRQDPEAAAKRDSRSPEEQHRYENHVRHMIPLAPQLDYLRAAGFEGIDVYWKQLDTVIYGGRRPLKS